MQNTQGILTYRLGSLLNRANLGSLFTAAGRPGFRQLFAFRKQPDLDTTNSLSFAAPPPEAPPSEAPPPEESSAEPPHAEAPHAEKFVHLIDNLWCDTYGVFVKGWAHAWDLPITVMRLKSGDFRVEVSDFHDRSDLATFFPSLHSMKCGFSAYLACSPFRPVVLEIETVDGSAEFEISALSANHPVNTVLPEPMFTQRRFADEMKRTGGVVVEIGARVVGPSSSLQAGQFQPECKFIGVDIHEAPGVDVVADAHFLGEHFEPGSIDGIFSYAVMEHLSCPWLLAAQINRVLKVGGLTLHSVPQAFPVHEMPNDFWRISSEGLKVLFAPEMGFEILEVGMTTPVKMYVHPAFREGPMLEFALHDGMAASYVLARKTFDLPDGAVSWPLQRSDSMDHSKAYPKH
ncbi:class I SAM-dependent methyltransferase [Mesorhizobium sp. M0586]|uniref:class I SAM-dependent methyltransferase n=1 Tax=unclassified Mesorhizobium TaxID=325217 RepID=UPI0033397B82